MVISIAVWLGVVAVGVLHSRWGQDQAREAIRKAIAAKFEVPVKLAGAQISPSGHVVLRGLDIEGALSAERIEAELDVFGAIGGSIRIRELAAADAAVDVPALLQALVPVKEPAEPLTLRIDHIGIERVTVAIGELAINADRVVGSLNIKENALAIDVSELDAGATVRDLSAKVTGGAGLFGNLLVLRGVRVGLGASSADVRFGLLDISDLRALALGGLDLRADDVRKVAASARPTASANAGRDPAPDRGAAPAAALRADLAAPVFVAQWAPGLFLALAGRLAGADMAVEASADERFDRVRAAVSATGLDPARVWAGALRGSLAVSLEGDAALAALDPAALARLDLRSLRANLSADFRGDLEGYGSGRLKVSATADGRASSLAVQATTNRGSLSANVKARSDAAGELHVDSARIDSSRLDLPIRTRALTCRINRVSLRASGPVDGLAVEASASASSLRAGATRAARVQAQADVRVDLVALAQRGAIPGSGTFSLTAGGVAAGALEVREISADGKFSDLGRHISVAVEAAGNRYAERASAALEVDLERTGTRIGIDEAAVVSAGETWAIAPAEIRFGKNGAITARGVSVSSSVGKLSIDGDTRELLTIELTQVDLARLAQVLKTLTGAEVQIAGTVSGKAEVRQGGATTSATVTVNGLAVPGVPPLDATIALGLDRGKATLELDASEPETGATAKLTANGRGPRSVLEAGGWSWGDRANLESATLRLDQVTTALIERIAGRPIPAQGTASIQLVAGPRAERLDLTANVSDVAVKGAPKLDLDLSASWNESGASLQLGVEHDQRRAITVAMTSPVKLSDVLAGKMRRPLAAPIDGTVEIAAFDLARLNHLGVLSQPIRGIAEAKLDVTGTVGDPTATMKSGRIQRLEIAGATFSRVTLSGQLDRRSFQAAVWAAQRRGGNIKIDAAMRWGKSRHAEIKIDANRFDLRFLRALADRPNHVLAEAAGTVNAHFEIEGSPDAPVGRGTLNLTGGQLLLEGGTRRLSDIALDARFNRDRIAIDRFSARYGDGALEAKGGAQLVGFLPRKFDLDLIATRIPIAAGDFTAEVESKISLSGELEGRWLRTRARIARGAIKIERARTELQNIGELDDVIFIDVPAKKAADSKTAGFPPIELKISAAQPIRVHGKEVDLGLSPSLTLTIENGELTSMRGRLKTTRGNLVMLDRRYRINVAEVTFDGEPDDPRLDIQLSREFPVAEVRVQVYGTAKAPKVALTSDAGHDPTQVLQIMLGQDPDRSSGTSVTDTAVSAGGSLLARNLLKGLPVKFDVVNVYRDGIEIGKWVLQDVLAGYRFRSEPKLDENQHEGTVEWNIFRRLVLEGRYGDHGIGNADILYILRF